MKDVLIIIWNDRFAWFIAIVLMYFSYPLIKRVVLTIIGGSNGI